MRWAVGYAVQGGSQTKSSSSVSVLSLLHSISSCPLPPALSPTALRPFTPIPSNCACTSQRLITLCRALAETTPLPHPLAPSNSPSHHSTHPSLSPTFPFSFPFPLFVLFQLFHLPIEEAAKALNIGQTMLKHYCRKFGIPRWPFRKRQSISILISSIEEFARNRPVNVSFAAAWHESAQKLRAAGACWAEL